MLASSLRPLAEKAFEYPNGDFSFQIHEFAARNEDAPDAKHDGIAHAPSQRDHVAAAQGCPFPRGHQRLANLDFHDYGYLAERCHQSVFFIDIHPSLRRHQRLEPTGAQRKAAIFAEPGAKPKSDWGADSKTGPTYAPQGERPSPELCRTTASPGRTAEMSSGVVNMAHARTGTGSGAAPMAASLPMFHGE